MRIKALGSFFVSALAFLVISLIVQSTGIYGQTLGEEKQPFYTVTDVIPSDEFLKLEGPVLNSLPGEIKLQDPTQSRFVIFKIVIQSEKEGLIEVDLADFVLTYEADGKKTSTPCVGCHMWADEWAFGKNGKGVYWRMKPPVDRRIIFVLPKSIHKVNFTQRQPDGTLKVIKSGLEIKAATDSK
jgi:hypothetical protein